jgi:hypothetical protein
MVVQLFLFWFFSSELFARTRTSYLGLERKCAPSALSFRGHNHAAKLENTPGRAIARASRQTSSFEIVVVFRKEVRVLATQRLTPKTYKVSDSEKELPAF